MNTEGGKGGLGGGGAGKGVGGIGGERGGEIRGDYDGQECSYYFYCTNLSSV